MSLNLADDWRVFDNLESVSYYSANGQSTFAAPVACQALRVTVTKTVVQDGRLLVGKTATAWQVWDTSGLSGTKPKFMDRIRDPQGVTWLVQGVRSYEAITGRWELDAEQSL